MIFRPVEILGTHVRGPAYERTVLSDLSFTDVIPERPHSFFELFPHEDNSPHVKLRRSIGAQMKLRRLHGLGLESCP